MNKKQAAAERIEKSQEVAKEKNPMKSEKDSCAVDYFPRT